MEGADLQVNVSEAKVISLGANIENKENCALL